MMLTIAGKDGDVAEVVSRGELSNPVDGALDRKDVGGEGQVRVIDDDVELEAIAGFVEATSLNGFVESELGDGDSDALEIIGLDSGADIERVEQSDLVGVVDDDGIEAGVHLIDDGISDACGLESLPIILANGRTLGVVLPVDEETAKFAAFGIQRLLQFL